MTPTPEEVAEDVSYAHGAVFGNDVDVEAAKATLAEALRAYAKSVDAAVGEERMRWIFALDAALRDEPDTANSEVNIHWRARICEAVRARIAAAVAEEREACAKVAEQPLAPTSFADRYGTAIAAAIRARGQTP